jgi:uncharacterized protein YlzI (FlbEa/FlbD family)
MEVIMDSGLLYVVYNEWICDPKTGEMPYKIGITTGTVDERYYGLGLKMPGEFICYFAYEFSLNSLKEIENSLQKLFQKDRINGEWFSINDTQLFAIKAVCEKKGGKLITEKIENEIESETEAKIIKSNNRQKIKEAKDHTQYKLNNVYYGKGRLVLAIVNNFIEKHPDLSYKELENIFSKELQGSVGVLDKYEDIVDRYKNINHKRHFLNDIIKLENGEKIVVSTEGGTGNIDKFINKAKDLGYNIE